MDVQLWEIWGRPRYNGAMTVRVRLFASLKDIAGQSELDLDLRDQATVRTIFKELQQRFPELARYEPVVLAAVNQEYCPWETPVGPGDEVVFFPPVSGGAS